MQTKFEFKKVFSRTKNETNNFIAIIEQFLHVPIVKCQMNTKVILIKHSKQLQMKRRLNLKLHEVSVREREIQSALGRIETCKTKINCQVVNATQR